MIPSGLLAQLQVCPPRLLVYLGWLVRDQHTLPSCDRIFYVLGVAVPFYSNQMTRRGNLSCKSEKDETVSLHTLIIKTMKWSSMESKMVVAKDTSVSKHT